MAPIVANARKEISKSHKRLKEILERWPGPRLSGAAGGKPKGTTRMRRRTSIGMRVTTTLAFVFATALVFAVAAVQARPATTARSLAATTALSDCTIVITGAPWHTRAHVVGGILSGNRYTLKARDVSCSSVRARVVAFTKQKATFRITGPAGYTCRSFSVAYSGDNLLYSGACMRGPHNHPFFEWGPKVPGH